MSTPDAVLFDLDGTLVDASEPIVDGILDLAAADGLCVPTRAWARSRIGYDPHETWRLLGAPDPRAQLLRFRDLMNGERRERLLAQTRVLPGVRETLEQLAGVGLRLAVATTRPTASARATLEAKGLLAFVETVAGADLVAAPKPAPDVLQHVLRALAVLAPRAVMVGDTDADVGAARAAGVRCYGVLSGVGDERTLRAAGADFILADISELARHVLVPVAPQPPGGTP